MKSRKLKGERRVQENPRDRNSIRTFTKIQNHCLVDNITFKEEINVGMIQRGIRTILKLKLPPFVRYVILSILDGRHFPIVQIRFANKLPADKEKRCIFCSVEYLDEVLHYFARCQPMKDITKEIYKFGLKKKFSKGDKNRKTFLEGFKIHNTSPFLHECTGCVICLGTQFQMGVAQKWLKPGP